MQEQMAQLQVEIADLRKEIKRLSSNTTIASDVESAFRERLMRDSSQASTAFTNTLSVDPGGVIVPKPMDGFLELKPGIIVPFYYNT